MFFVVGILFHVFMNAFNAKQSVKKFLAVLAYPFSAVTVAMAVITALNYAGSVIFPQGLVGFYVVLVLSTATIGLTVYGFVLYTMMAANSYKSKLSTAAIAMVLTVIVLFLVSSSPAAGQGILSGSVI